MVDDQPIQRLSFINSAQAEDRDPVCAQLIQPTTHERETSPGRAMSVVRIETAVVLPAPLEPISDTNFYISHFLLEVGRGLLQQSQIKSFAAYDKLSFRLKDRN